MKPNDSRIATIDVLYFARLREVFGREREQVELPGNVQDVGGLTAWLRSRGDAWERELAPGKPVRIAVNQDMAAALKFAGYDYRFEFGDGGHSGKQGSMLFPDTMRWLWRDWPKE